MPDWNRADFERYYKANAEPWGRPGGRPPVVLHYHDWWIGDGQSNEGAPLVWNALGLNPGDGVVLVGCGFNWTGRGLQQLGAEVIGVDTSPYILAEEQQTEEAEIRDCIIRAGLNPDVDVVGNHQEAIDAGVAGMNFLDIYLRGGRAAPQRRGAGTIAAEDLSTPRSRNVIAGLMTANARYVLTEETLNSVDDNTALLICEAAQRYADQKGAAGCQVVHILSPLQPNKNQANDLNWKLYSEWRALLDANGFQSQGIIASASDNERVRYAEVF